MDKNAIKKYAVWARRELIERVSQRALVYGITATDAGDPNAESVNGHLLSQVEKRQRQALIRNIREKGYAQVMEEVAYTWFNRFAALRFMEVNGYLPSHIRVFTNDAGAFKPQILAEAIHLELDGLDRNKVYELESANKSEELFKYLLIVQCNALNSILPGMFQRIEDYTELLLPDYLLREGSVIEQMVTTIPEADWTDQVQIIGWLYQYYNTEPKDKVFADLKKNIKITKENIPAATQLFTPDWIVHYMVENSLGRLWLEGHPNDALKSEWKYYLDEAEQEPEVQVQLAEIRKEYAALKPEEIRVIDPCMGSGHILCVLFDVLVRIYEDYGYTAREAAVKIVENNLWGLDIDERAAQLAYFAVMMKARQYDRRFFTRKVQPHVYSPKGYADGEQFGSLITVDELEPMPQKPEEITLFDEDYETQLNRWNFRRVLAQKYDVVVTNPPYMGASNMNNKLSDFVKKNYPDEKSDMFACFINRGLRLITPNGFNCMVTMQSWMFLSSFEKMREKIIANSTITNLMHMENMVMGIAFGTAVSVFRGSHITEYKGTYNHIQMKDIQNDRPIEFPVHGNRFAQVSSDNFSKIPGSPVAYWVSIAGFGAFEAPDFSQKFMSGGRNKTHNNDLYVRSWWEVAYEDSRWQPYSNGGEYRKWFGNNIDVVDWSPKARESFASHGGLIAEEYWDIPAITWNDITSGKASFRIKPENSKYSSVSPTLISHDGKYDYTMLAFLNSTVSEWLNDITNPTLHTIVGNVLSFPNKIDNINTVAISANCVELSESDWDSFETSWDFKKNPLV